MTAPSRYRRPAARKISPLMAEAFRCPHFAITLSRHACAKMNRQAHGSSRSGRDALSASEASRCKGCPIGAAHRKGERHAEAPRVTPIVPHESTRARA
jgi:hypothetical protein